MKVPCELIIWNILPAIRREFARILVEEFNLTQREVAKKLGVTESAVSQYMKSKRGSRLEFDRKISREIKKVMREVSKSGKESLLIEKTCSICSIVKRYGFLCKIHKEDSKNLNDCKICLGNLEKSKCI